MRLHRAPGPGIADRRIPESRRRSRPPSGRIRCQIRQRICSVVRPWSGTTSPRPMLSLSPIHRLNVGPRPGQLGADRRHRAQRPVAPRSGAGGHRAEPCRTNRLRGDEQRYELADAHRARRGAPRLQQFLGTLALLFRVQAERRRGALGPQVARASWRTIGQENPLLASASANLDRKGWMSRRATLFVSVGAAASSAASRWLRSSRVDS